MSTLDTRPIDPAAQVNQALDACAKQCAEAAQQCCDVAKQCASNAKRTVLARAVDFLVWLNAAIASEGPSFAVYEDRRKFDVEAQQRVLQAAIFGRR